MSSSVWGRGVGDRRSHRMEVWSRTPLLQAVGLVLSVGCAGTQVKQLVFKNRAARHTTTEVNF